MEEKTAEALSLVEKGTNMAIEYAPKVALALLTLIVGFWIIKKIVGFAGKAFERSGLDISLNKFLSSILGVLLKIMLLLSVASMFGVDTTSFVAIVAALMVGIGMALNGTIGHFASGVMLMIFKPFTVGDLVKIGGNQETGTVEAINAFNTTLETLDNKRIIIGNSNVTGNDITNITGQEHIGVELSYNIAYDEDIDKARDIIMKVGKSCPHILDNPGQGVVVAALNESAVQLNTRPFCKGEHYWDTLFYMQEHVKKEFTKAGIKVPFPKMNVQMINA